MKPASLQDWKLRASLGATATICIAVILASFANPHLLKNVIETSWVLPAFLIIFFGRGALGLVVFFHPVRPKSARTIKAAFWRDAWLSDRIKARHPIAAAVLGGSIVAFAGMNMALIVAGIVAALFAPVAMSSLVQSFVLIVWVSILVRLVGSGILLVMEAASNREVA
jgi:hypothetical protein